MIKTSDNIVKFEPKDDGGPVTESDPLGLDVDLDLDDLHVGAHVIYGSLSSIDMAKTTPEVFWYLFGSPNAKPSALKWLNSALKKLTEIEKAMPE